MKHARKTLAAVALFGLAPLVGCDQNGIEDASAPTTTPDRQPPPADTTPPPPDREPPPATDPGDPGGIDDPSSGG